MNQDFHPPRVSTVVIFRDAERFLEEAIASVFGQTYSDWELLLVDDGSVDGSPVLARRVADDHPQRVRYLQHPGGANRGMSASRNLGIRHARGEYLAFLDADDVWLPSKLAAQVALLDGNPEAAMVYGPTQWWYSWTGLAEDQGRDSVHPLGVRPDTLLLPPTVLMHLLRNEDVSPCTCSILARRAIVERIGGFEESFRGLYEDQAFCAKLCLSFPVLASSQCLYLYRQHPDSACAVAGRTDRAREARWRFLIWLEAYLAAHPVADVELWSVLREELWRTRRLLLRKGFGRTRQFARRVKQLLVPG